MKFILILLLISGLPLPVGAAAGLCPGKESDASHPREVQSEQAEVSLTTAHFTISWAHGGRQP